MPCPAPVHDVDETRKISDTLLLSDFRGLRDGVLRFWDDPAAIEVVKEQEARLSLSEEEFFR